MFGAIGRWIKAVGYLLTGRIDSARRELDSNPHVMRARYDAVVQEKIERIHHYKQAVASLIAQKENKVAKIKTLTEDVGRLENLKSGALAKAKVRLKELQAQGLGKEQIQADAEYMKCQGAFRDFTSTLAEKQARIEELEHDVETYTARVSQHKVQLTSLLREVENLKAEAADAVADVITSKEEKEIADTLAGIAKDGTSEELQRMRQLRQELKAEATISKELSGADTRTQEAEFMAYASRSSADDEFDALIGLAETTDQVVSPKETETKDTSPGLPE